MRRSPRRNPGSRRVTAGLLAWCLVVLPFLTPGPVQARLAAADPAPRFSLANLTGGSVEVTSTKGKRLLILYFFDPESPPSLAGLRAMDRLARQFPSKLTVYGVSSSPAEAISRCLAGNGITLEVLRDTRGVRELYGARQLLPVGCAIGEDFRVIAYFQGGGAGLTKAMSRAVGREVTAPPHRAPGPAGAKGAGGHTVEKPPLKSAATHLEKPPGKGSRDASVEPGGAGEQGSVGKIINERDWNSK